MGRGSSTASAKRRSSWKRTAGTAALIMGAMTGYLLVSGALDPVLTQAIALAQRKADADSTHSSATAPVADWMYFDDRPEWSSVRGVPQVPGPTGPSDPVRPTIAPPENPIHFPFAGPPPMPHYSLKPMTDCPQQHGPGYGVQNFTSSVGTTSVSITWWDLNDPDIIDYEIYAIPQFTNEGNMATPVNPPASKTKIVTPPRACKQVTATITGLTTGQQYQIYLESKNKNEVGNGPPYMVTRGQTETLFIK
jgi:hypothetical protein